MLETEYVFILNPDAILLKNTLANMCKILSNEDFTIAAPFDTKDMNSFTFNQNGVADVNFVKGFAMILNKKKMKNEFFDEKIFLYLEEIDLCKRVKNAKGRVIKVDILIEHVGGLSHGNKDDMEMEKSKKKNRNNKIDIIKLKSK